MILAAMNTTELVVEMGGPVRNLNPKTSAIPVQRFTN